MTLEEKITSINDTILGERGTAKYLNYVDLSGWVIHKPNIFTNSETGRVSASIIIYQISSTNQGQTVVKSFNAITYTTQVIEKFKQDFQEHVGFIALKGGLQWNSKYKKYEVVIYDYNHMIETDIDIEPKYERK